MRITRETLIKLAQETVAERVRANRGIITAYISGSLLTQEPLLGGTTDIDLFLIHDSQPAFDREIVLLSSDVHLDIFHHSQALYHQPRHLRSDPRLGSIIYYNPLLLHDTQHWFEFTQASVRSLFWEGENVMRRTRPLATQARQTWVKLQRGSHEPLALLTLFLESLEAAANAVACLTGAPLPERRFLLIFPERAQAVESPGLAMGLEGLVGAANLDLAAARELIPAWKAAFQAAGAVTGAPAEYDPARLPYFERAIEAMFSSSTPQAAIWPLLNTWTRALAILAQPSAPHQTGPSAHLDAWLQACSQLGLDLGDFKDRLSGLDAYLDSIEETLDQWSRANGVEAAT